MSTGLVQLLVKLLEHRGQVSEDNFANFIEPIFREIESIHEDYTTSLQDIEKKVAAMVSTAQTSTKEVNSDKANADLVAMIREKQARQAHIRVLVAELVQAMPKTVLEKNTAALFVGAVREYLHYMAGELLYGDLLLTETALGDTLAVSPTKMLSKEFSSTLERDS